MDKGVGISLSVNGMMSTNIIERCKVEGTDINNFYLVPLTYDISDMHFDDPTGCNFAMSELLV
jgi:hypothetical protein